MTSLLPDATSTTLAPDSEVAARSRRDEVAVAVFGTWMMTGLYLDGWAHNVNKPETFFSPWHGVLYSGFVAALIWFAVDGVRQTGRVRDAVVGVPNDRATGLGLVLFIAGALGDGVWHQIFGIEVDLEALLSPTHLLLLLGGFLMLTMPLRAAYADPSDDASSWRRFVPAAVSLTLAAALVSFFTMYLSAFLGIGTYWVEGGGEVREVTEMAGVGAILATNLILIVPLLYTLRRWRTPPGTFTILFGMVALSMTAIDEFRTVTLVVPALLAGAVADLLIRRDTPSRLIAGIVPIVLWSTAFLAVEVDVGVEWAAELVAGSVALASMSSVLLAAALGSAAPDRLRTRTAGDR